MGTRRGNKSAVSSKRNCNKKMHISRTTSKITRQQKNKKVKMPNKKIKRTVKSVAPKMIASENLKSKRNFSKRNCIDSITINLKHGFRNLTEDSVINQANLLTKNSKYKKKCHTSTQRDFLHNSKRKQNLQEKNIHKSVDTRNKEKSKSSNFAADYQKNNFKVKPIEDISFCSILTNHSKKKPVQRRYTTGILKTPITRLLVRNNSFVLRSGKIKNSSSRFFGISSPGRKTEVREDTCHINKHSEKFRNQTKILHPVGSSTPKRKRQIFSSRSKSASNRKNHGSVQKTTPKVKNLPKSNNGSVENGFFESNADSFLNIPNGRSSTPKVGSKADSKIKKCINKKPSKSLNIMLLDTTVTADEHINMYFSSRKSNKCQGMSDIRKNNETKKRTRRFKSVPNMKLFQSTPIDPIDNAAKKTTKTINKNIPTKNSLKRKRWMMNQLKKNNSGHEDDLFESKAFEDIKEYLVDVDESDFTLSMPTPKCGVSLTPLVHKRTPVFKDCISPTELALFRKAAEECQFRNKRKKVVDETFEPKKKLNFSAIAANIAEKQNKIDILLDKRGKDDSCVEDSYFSTC